MGALVLVNPSDHDWTKHRYILWFGACAPTYLMLWANGLDDALDEAIDWIADNAPGLLADEMVKEEYDRGIAAGLSVEKAQEEVFTEQLLDYIAGRCDLDKKLLGAWVDEALDGPEKEAELK